MRLLLERVEPDRLSHIVDKLRVEGIKVFGGGSVNMEAIVLVDGDHLVRAIEVLNKDGITASIG
jgi:hypothetical protein